MIQELIVYIILAGAVTFSAISIVKIFKKGKNRKGNYYCSGCNPDNCGIMK